SLTSPRSSISAPGSHSVSRGYGPGEYRHSTIGEWRSRRDGGSAGQIHDGGPTADKAGHMSARFQEHHFRKPGKARDHLTETIVCMQSAVERMTGDDWIDASALLQEIVDDIGPRLAILRTAARDRFNDHTRLPDFEDMRTGRMPFPDERLHTEAPL